MGAQVRVISFICVINNYDLIIQNQKKKPIIAKIIKKKEKTKE